MQHLTSDLLIDYLHRELPPADDARVLAHLEACEECKRELNVEATITDRLRAMARAEDFDLPLGMHSRIMSRIADLQPPSWHGLRRFLRPIVIVPFAAAVAAGTFFLTPVLSPSTAPSAALPVSYYLQEHDVRAQDNPLGDRSAVILSSLNSTNDGVPVLQAVDATH
ncbi:MAG TPA: zf-HC2 domain-containing protein [Candidatus Acidoferrales bacterium]|nr:zf-HC2 domain-containing protein [Candidatus Acidoferrales bacterium]